MKAASTDFRHDVPDELRVVLDADPSLHAKWDDLTSLARNEWICWMTSPTATAR